MVGKAFAMLHSFIVLRKKCQKFYFFKNKSWFFPEKETFFSNKEHFWFQKKNISSIITVLNLNLFFFRVFVLRVNQRTFIRVQRSIHSEVSLHVFGSSEVVYGAHSMTCVWTRLNVCREGLYDMLCVGWTDIYDMPPKEDRCALLRLDKDLWKGALSPA
jgi:hypothetical protein